MAVGGGDALESGSGGVPLVGNPNFVPLGAAGHLTGDGAVCSEPQDSVIVGYGLHDSFTDDCSVVPDLNSFPNDGGTSRTVGGTSWIS